LEEAQDESESGNTYIRVKLSLLILDGNAIKIGDVGADKDGKIRGNLEAIRHILLSYLFNLIQIIAVLYLLLDAVSVAQQRHNFIAVTITIHVLHYMVA
jgi:hypothetical protein